MKKRQLINAYSACRRRTWRSARVRYQHEVTEESQLSSEQFIAADCDELTEFYINVIIIIESLWSSL